jgi:hypothetical protein
MFIILKESGEHNKLNEAHRDRKVAHAEKEDLVKSEK